ncbi:MAG: glycoside hydrolase family 25 protein, partial [Prevotella melaninogenica]|nr:glycoside hydrolase family 25 protein [Prevotella melaninogenica]
YYVNQMEYQGAWKFWQHTDAGRLPGIKGYVDLDIYNGSFYDLQQLLIQDDVTDVQVVGNTNRDSTNVDSLSDRVH